MPDISTVLLSDSKTVVFTGNNYNLFSTGYKAKAFLGNVPASSVVETSSTQITATWDKGVPALPSA